MAKSNKDDGDDGNSDDDNEHNVMIAVTERETYAA